LTPQAQWFFSAAELARFASQRRVDELLWATATGLKIAFLVAVPLLGIHLLLRSWGERLGRALPAGRLAAVLQRMSAAPGAGRWGADVLVPVLLVALYALLTAPLDFFRGYLLAHERGLATLSAGRFWADWAMALGQGLVLAGLFGLGVFALARRLARSWWLALWGAVVLALVGFAMLAPYRARLVHEFRPLGPGPLRQSLERVLEGAGLRAERIEVMDSSRRTRLAGAHVTGQGPTRRVVLADNLVRNFPPREVAVAVAHELGHTLERHPWRNLALEALGALLFLFGLHLALRHAHRLRALRLRPGVDPAVLPVVLLVAELLFLLHQPLAVWRTRAEEVRADAVALRLTRDPVAFCSLFLRLARHNQADPDPPALSRFLFGSHPAVMERIRTGFAWAAAHGIGMDRQALPLALPVSQLSVKQGKTTGTGPLAGRTRPGS